MSKCSHLLKVIFQVPALQILDSIYQYKFYTHENKTAI